MAKWILNILGAIIIAYIVDLLLTNTKLQKAVRYVLSTITLLIIVTPISSLIKGDGFNANIDFNYQPVIDDKYLNYVMEKKFEILSSNAEKILEEKGVANAKVDIEGSVNEKGEVNIEMVKINLSESVIDEKIQHINSNDFVKEVVLGYLLVEESAIVCYG